MVRLPQPIRFRPPKEREEQKVSVMDQLRDLPSVPRAQVDQLQTAALAARLTSILEQGGATEGDSDRLTRLDMNSELLLRRMAVILRKQAPKVGPAE